MINNSRGIMNQNNGVIYIATNLINGKQYVGQTVQKLHGRIACHKYQAKKNIHNNIFHNAVNKYNLKNFKWVSFSCPEKDLDWQETFLIKELNTLAPNGYNLETGGHVNKHHHKLTKEKMRENHWDCSGVNNPQFGKIRPLEHKKHLSESHKGQHSSPKTEFKKGQIPWNEGKKCPQLSGENNPSVKLIINDVKIIKKMLLEDKYTRREISKIFKVSKSTIQAIAEQRIWKEVEAN